jgi:quercetin dioxygenase-like cupin family protein
MSRSSVAVMAFLEEAMLSKGILVKPAREVNPFLRRGVWRYAPVLRHWCAIILAIVLTGCAGMAPQPSSSAGILYIGPQPQRWEEIVRANPLGSDENIKGVQLLQQPMVSHFLVQIRDREQPHIHQEHDATIVMLRGQGRLVLKDRILIAREGDVLFIPRGTPHYYVNDGPDPTVVLAIFSPAYDGKDAEVVPFEDRPQDAP